MDVFEKVKEILVKEAGCELEEITLTSSFEDLDIDSLDFFQIINMVEHDFGITMEFEEEVGTVKDLVKYIKTKLN